MLAATAAIRAELFGSLGATGRGHGSDSRRHPGAHGRDAGRRRRRVDRRSCRGRARPRPAEGPGRARGRRSGRPRHLAFHRGEPALPPQRDAVHRPRRAGGAAPRARLLLGRRRLRRGGAGGRAAQARGKPDDGPRLPHPFSTAAELLDVCAANGLSISEVMLRERDACGARRRRSARGLLRIWAVMQECVKRGIATGGVLPGGLKVKRRAAGHAPPASSRAPTRRPAIRSPSWTG